MATITAGSTANTFQLKAGQADIYIADKLVDPVFTQVTSTLDAALTAVAATMTTPTAGGDPAYEIGMVLCIPSTNEKVVVDAATSGVGPYTTGIAYRGQDGTIATAAAAGATVKIVGFGAPVSGDVSSVDTTITLGAAVGSQMATAIGDPALWRASKSSPNKEIIESLQYNAGTPSLYVKRNYTLKKTAKLGINDSGNNFLDDEMMFVASNTFYDPTSQTYLDSQWRQIEVIDSITISEELENIETISNLRKGPNYNGMNFYSISGTFAITDPKFLGWMRGNVPTMTNAVSTAGTDTELQQIDEGHSLDTYIGEKLEGVMFYIKGLEPTSERQFQFLAFSAEMTEKGEISMSNDQRGIDLTFICAAMPGLNGPGVLRNPQAC